MVKPYKAAVQIDLLPKRANVVIFALLELVGAQILIDGELAMNLWPEGLVKRNAFFGLFARSLTRSQRATARLLPNQGEHVITIAKEKYEPIVRTVNVICRPVDVGKGLWARVFGAWFKPVHCRLQVSCPCSDGQSGPKGPFNQTVGQEAVNGGYQLTTDQFLAPRFRGPSQDYDSGWFSVPVRPPSEAKGCDFERCILNEARARQSTTPQSFPSYKIGGPNSNSYARNLVDTCGGSADWPENAYGATTNPFWGGRYEP